MQDNINQKCAKFMKRLLLKLNKFGIKLQFLFFIVSEKFSLIKREHEKLLNLLKSYHGRKKNFNFQHKVQAFKKEAKALFDVAACKCNDFELCHCEESRKVPIKEQPFITDQRSAREMAIGSVDLRTTQQLQKRASRKMRYLNLEEARIAKLQKSKLATSTESLKLLENTL
ncbi:hypothetical protein JTE90_006805 [Oedothorax gibbosus]|uniref:Uncharacterized protein n=1 Tax=Oedothorax gibbosus TaxID=931172 RepID=A0AAV6VPL0_9ARAC|nr:hypothetical protein JTE90_006805 [Oedothorax gibbosus]